MYFANNEGLLVFDGVTWHLSKMPNSSLTRSVYINETEGIFVGAYNELGKMEYRTNGKLEFKSLKKYLKWKKKIAHILDLLGKKKIKESGNTIIMKKSNIIQKRKFVYRNLSNYLDFYKQMKVIQTQLQVKCKKIKKPLLFSRA